MTPHDAATRERVREAILKGLHARGKWAGTELADGLARAALSALQPPPKGWEVSNATEAGYRSGTDAYDGHSNNWFMDEEGIASRKAGIRGAAPHLLRDLADGVSEEHILTTWSRAMKGPDSIATRNFLRALADTLEGKPHA